MNDPATDQTSKPSRSPVCDVIERNIVKLTNLRRKADEQRGLPGKMADFITGFSGSLSFVYLHVGWFGFWILANTGKFGIEPFDPFPYGLLTMIVSLEAIFLSSFVLISQNRLDDEADQRANLDLQIGLLTEHEMTRALRMLDEVRQKLGIQTQEGGPPGGRPRRDRTRAGAAARQAEALAAPASSRACPSASLSRPLRRPAAR